MPVTDGDHHSDVPWPRDPTGGSAAPTSGSAAPTGGSAASCCYLYVWVSDAAVQEAAGQAARGGIIGDWRAVEPGGDLPRAGRGQPQHPDR
jgi:hypothetical protein